MAKEIILAAFYQFKTSLKIQGCQEGHSPRGEGGHGFDTQITFGVNTA